MFEKLFKSKKSSGRTLTLTTDIHSHLIPGIDDGSQHIEDSLEYLRQFSALGYTKIITTPHVMFDHYKNDQKTILQGLEYLKEETKKANISIEIEAAAEYYFDEQFEQLIENKNLLTFGNNFVLFETNTMVKPAVLEDRIFKAQLNGYKMVLAHPERYMYMLDDFSMYKTLKNKGVYFQLNLASVTGYYGKPSQKIAYKLLQYNMIDFLGSDCHHQRHIDSLKEALHHKIFSEVSTEHIKNADL